MSPAPRLPHFGFRSIIRKAYVRCVARIGPPPITPLGAPCAGSFPGGVLPETRRVRSRATVNLGGGFGTAIPELGSTLERQESSGAGRGIEGTSHARHTWFTTPYSIFSILHARARCKGNRSKEIGKYIGLGVANHVCLACVSANDPISHFLTTVCARKCAHTRSTLHTRVVCCVQGCVPIGRALVIPARRRTRRQGDRRGSRLAFSPAARALVARRGERASGQFEIRATLRSVARWYDRRQQHEILRETAISARLRAYCAENFAAGAREIGSEAAPLSYRPPGQQIHWRRQQCLGARYMLEVHRFIHKMSYLICRSSTDENGGLNVRLVSVKVGPFKSINEPCTVKIEPTVTVLVGMNEAGKTVFLQALEKARDARNRAKFDKTPDYPRKDLPAYSKVHDASPSPVVKLSLVLSQEELESLNKKHNINLDDKFLIEIEYDYKNGDSIYFDVDERPAIRALSLDPRLSSDAKVAVEKSTSIKNIAAQLKSVSLSDVDKNILKEVEGRIAASKWDKVIEHEIWTELTPKIPKFLYFSDYDLLPSKMNLADLAARVEKEKTTPGQLTAAHDGILALLRMADISLGEFSNAASYEDLKAKIEGVSINLTDQIMKFWKQNDNLEVEIDIKEDKAESAPFDNGPNLYLRIKNRRHRGVSTPFQQRSRGFIWFFSFLVWFDSVKERIRSSDELILLLDEPALALHALAQRDFLNYIDELSARHQVIFSTHSPFMVHSERLHQVRLVEDKDEIGTIITETTNGTDSRTLFPLQAALGWTIAQNLFISERNILVEGPSELIYLKLVSSILEAEKKEALREDITIVPVGGLDKLATFIALLGANQLKLAVFHDHNGNPDQRLLDMIRRKIIHPKFVLHAGQFRDPKNIGAGNLPTDTEDLFSVDLYLKHFNATFSSALGANTVVGASLPAGDRIVDRIERWLAANNVQTRPSGGFNHYLVASHFASNPPASLDDDTKDRFVGLFHAINQMF